VRIDSDCNRFSTFEQINEEYFFASDGKIIDLRYSSPDQFHYNLHHDEFLNSLFTLQRSLQ
jgi:hypothetical protein